MAVAVGVPVDDLVDIPELVDPCVRVCVELGVSDAVASWLPVGDGVDDPVSVCDEVSVSEADCVWLGVAARLPDCVTLRLCDCELVILWLGVPTILLVCVKLAVSVPVTLGV